jgi:hypothetical protein
VVGLAEQESSLETGAQHGKQVGEEVKSYNGMKEQNEKPNTLNNSS